MGYMKDRMYIKNMELKNRLVLPPMETVLCESNGEVSEDLLKYYDEITKGGYIGLVIVEHTYISPEGKVKNGQLSVADDSKIEGLKKLAKTIQANGSKVVLQLSHAGSNCLESSEGAEAVGPSPIINPRSRDKLIPRELSVAEIKELVKKFGEAARRAKTAGFDGVEIHSAHGYLLNQFLSPLTNKRDDEYGRDLLGRIKFHLEVIETVKKEVGRNYAIFLRIGASDYMEGGTTIEEGIIASRKFVNAGVDVIDVTGGLCGYMGPQFTGQGYFSELSEKIKKEIFIPVILTGGITDPAVAETLLRQKKADLIGVGRAIVKDYDWARKAMEK